MKIKEILEESRKKLTQNNFEDAGIISRELLCYTLHRNKQYLVINSNKEVNAKEYSQYINNLKEVIDGKPLQYITNKQEFMGLDFYVDENVLIPQPDTEILVEYVLELCNHIKNREIIKILDLCTGSGAIAISLSEKLNAKNIKNKIIASDISKKALAIAEKNNIGNNTKVEFVQSNLFENIKDNDFDIIVSNPPYIKDQIIAMLPKQVQCEPILALAGGADGLNFYRSIIDKAYLHMISNGYLCLEIGYDQKKDVLGIFREIRKL